MPHCWLPSLHFSFPRFFHSSLLLEWNLWKQWICGVCESWPASFVPGVLCTACENRVKIYSWTWSAPGLIYSRLAAVITGRVAVRIASYRRFYFWARSSESIQDLRKLNLRFSRVKIELITKWVSERHCVRVKVTVNCESSPTDLQRYIFTRYIVHHVETSYRARAN